MLVLVLIVLFKLRSSWFLEVTNDFLSKSGHSEYYAIRLLIYLNLLSVPSGINLAQKGGCHLGGDGSPDSPFSLFFGECSLLLLFRGGSSGSPLDLF